MVNNKADHTLLMRAAELGILKSLQDLPGVLEPGRLKRLLLDISLYVDAYLKKMYRENPNFFVDNRTECAVYLEKFGLISGIKAGEQGEVHIAEVVAFCVFFMKDTKSKYTPNLLSRLTDLLDYFERTGEVNFSTQWKDKNFTEEWNGITDA